MNGQRFCISASTGQNRLLALVLRSAQAQYFNQRTERRPILLLDDVLLELDARKKESFLKSLPEHRQAFFTFLPDEKYVHYAEKGTLIYNVNRGKLKEWNEQEKS
jgi:DNA replication and repair protein RecF